MVVVKSLFYSSFRKCLHHVRSCWSMTYNSGKLLPNHPAPQPNPPSQPASIAPCLCWDAGTHLPPNAMAVRLQSWATASLYCVHWQPTLPSGRSWYCRVSSENCLSTTCAVALEPWGRRSASSSVCLPGIYTQISKSLKRIANTVCSTRC